jgi:hypothetical protein
MRAALPLIGGALALAGCAAPVPQVARMQTVDGYTAQARVAGLAVMRNGVPFGYADGAEAKRAANAICGGAVNSTIRDRFDGGAWVFVGGCA